MSQENVEVVPFSPKKKKNGDYSAVEWADPDIEFVTVDGPPPPPPPPKTG